jgi:hypothetical protein
MAIPGSAGPFLLAQLEEEGGYEIERSLRFNSSDSAYLSKNFGSAGNRKTWTWAGWVKLSSVTTAPSLFMCRNGGGDSGVSDFIINSDGTVVFTGAANTFFTTTQVLRDFSAWYHLVLSVDTTAATAGNRIRFYLNGSQVTTFNNSYNPTQNFELAINQAAEHDIGGKPAVGEFFNGYLADIHFIDGQALDPSSFGEFDTNGVWQPIDASGLTFGTNGFRLPFSDNSTAAALGTDTSSNGNTWTVNNFSVDQVTDLYSPTSNTNLYGMTWAQAFQPSNQAGVYSLDSTTATGTLRQTKSYSSSVELLCCSTNGSAPIYANGVAVTSPPTGNNINDAQWRTVLTGSGTLSSVAVQSNGAQRGILFQIRVDGTQLVDLNAAGNDSLVDFPTNGSQVDTGVGGEVVGNYCTWNPLAKGANVSLSNGNLDASTSTTSGYGTVLGTVGMSSGQWYWEFTGGTGTLGVGLGIAEGSKNLATYLGADVGYEYYSENGNKYSSAGGAAYGSSWGSGDVIGVTFDADAGTLSFYKNGVSQGTAYTGLTNTPYFPAVADSSATNVLNGFVNFGQRQWAYAAPAGFKALCTTNLPEPTIADGSTVMDVKTFTGNHPTGQSITSLNFSPDFVWLKDRAGTNWHYVFDTIRGTEKAIFTNATNAENTYSGTLTSFNSDGFTLGSDNATNQNGNGYVAWTWDAGSSTVSNTEGSITSQVRANASAGFSVVTFNSGNSDGEFSVGHGLGVAPRLIIMKSRTRSGGPWWVHHLSATDTTTKYLQLSTTSAVIDNGGSGSIWGAALPTSTVFGFSVGAGRAHTQNEDIVSYCFAPVAGYSAFGRYTGNGSADGPFVYTGHRVKYLMVKRTDSTGDWFILDGVREPYNYVSRQLGANNSGAESGPDAYNVDFTANGFKLRNSIAGFNASAGSYAYIAFAESPFQYARAR